MCGSDGPALAGLLVNLLGYNAKGVICSVGVEQRRACLYELAGDDDGAAREGEPHAAEQISVNRVRRRRDCGRLRAYSMIGSLRLVSISAASAPDTAPEDVPLPAVAEGAADDMEVELGNTHYAQY
jgi:hypothetical protein